VSVDARARLWAKAVPGKYNLLRGCRDENFAGKRTAVSLCHLQVRIASNVEHGNWNGLEWLGGGQDYAEFGNKEPEARRIDQRST
jgi:hypothetical protein